MAPAFIKPPGSTSPRRALDPSRMWTSVAAGRDHHCIFAGPPLLFPPLTCIPYLEAAVFFRLEADLVLSISSFLITLKYPVLLRRAPHSARTRTSLRSFTFLLPVKNFDMSTEHQSQGPTELVGPDYRPTSQKPEATVSTPLSHANVHILPQTPQLLSLLT